MGGDVPQRDVWVRQLARGLLQIANSHVLHLVIKPDNILISVNDRDEKTIKFIDFGTSLEVHDHRPRHYGRSGTLEYMSPELEERRPFSFPTDVWSLGVVFFQVGQAVCQKKTNHVSVCA